MVSHIFSTKNAVLLPVSLMESLARLIRRLYNADPVLVHRS